MLELQHNGQNYSIEGKIGQGYTAEVFKAVSRSKKTMCVKIINDSFYKQTLGKSLIENEIKILSKLTHPNILTFVKKQHKNKLMIITQYCSGGTLYDFLGTKKKLSPAETLPIMKQLIEGCKYMHGQGILHRDLKPENIFFIEQNRKNIKIADFGFAVALKDSKLMTANVGSPLYMPYEALTSMKFSVQSDIFALGVIWYELLTGKTPFAAASEKELKQLTKNQYFRKIDLPCSLKISNLIFKCLKFNPSERPSLTDLLAGITEPSHTEKMKSKSVHLTVKESVKVKETKQSKENKDPLLGHPGVNRNDRCKTNYQKLKPAKVNDKNTMPLRLNQGQVSQQIVDESKRRFSQNSLLSTDQLLCTLKNLTPKTMSFLPLSVQQKFSILLNLYERLLFGSSDMAKVKFQATKDELIESLVVCQTEQDFCIASFGFLRRLLRLAKTYNVNVDELTKLWNHVQARCLSSKV